MYISLNQISVLDNVVKGFEVALRSFVAEGLFIRFPLISDLRTALQNISFPSEVIYARKFEARLKSLSKNIGATHAMISNSASSVQTKTSDGDVPYVSEVVDLLLIFFNDVYSAKNIAKEFSTIEEFHYCASLYHLVRNNLSHPASRPIDEADAAKVLYFISNLVDTLEEKYFWYAGKAVLLQAISEYKQINNNVDLKVENINFAPISYKQLICRDVEIDKVYSAIIGGENRKRVAGSLVIYGYGGVGKTAITTEFLLRLIRDKKDGKHPDIEFILFYSSKDEYLRSSESTGAFYIDETPPQFSTLDELKKLIFTSLSITSIEEISRYKRGIIVIDNIENIEEFEKKSILELIKATPRNIQFILTSRSDEQCEEKIHIGEFSKDALGIKFVSELIDSEDFDLEVDDDTSLRIIDVSKGNALIILQILNTLSRGLETFESLVRSLESLGSSNSENIANFMYKNTFHDVVRELSDKNFSPEKIIQIISLYEERIEPYSISMLAGVEIGHASTLCNILAQRLILVKTGEYYELNEFARRFVFLRLLPDRISLRLLKERIADHKSRMTDKLNSVDAMLQKKKNLKRILSEWQPRNYIDRIVIAETFLLYLNAFDLAESKDRSGLERCFLEFAEHKKRTNHPYVAFQEARLLKLWLKFRGVADQTVLDNIENAYEEAIYAIEFDCRYLLNTPAHASLLMLYGIFLVAEHAKPDRAIRYFEAARGMPSHGVGKIWFLSSSYLALCYKRMIEEGFPDYLSALKAVCNEIISHDGKVGKKTMNMGIFKRNFAGYIGK